MNALAIPIPAIRSDIARLGGHGGGGDDVEARIATLESDVRHIRSDVSDIKVDLRRLDDKFESMRTEFSGQIQDVRTDLSGQITQVRSELSGKFDDLARSLASAKVWAVLLYVSLAATLLGVMAHGFGWV